MLPRIRRLVSVAQPRLRIAWTMSEQLWTAFDNFVVDHLIPDDAALSAAIERSEAAGLPAIQVSPCFGKAMHLMVRAMGASRILEIGTLGGYSTIWLARALGAGGRLISLEASPRHAEVARANVARAGLDGVVEIRVGAALNTLPAIESEQLGPFDFFFIDADKENIPEYFDWAVRLSRAGSLIVVDNVVREGAVLDAESQDTAVRGVRRFMDQLGDDDRVSATVLQTVGSKKYDGFALAVVLRAGKARSS